MTTSSQIKIRAWVADVAYAEDDFVIDMDDGDQATGRPGKLIELLDELDPDWRLAFEEDTGDN